MTDTEDDKFKDYKKAGYILTILGLTCCLPWNFFMSAYDYYMFRLRLGEGNNNYDTQCEVAMKNLEKYMTPVLPGVVEQVSNVSAIGLVDADMSSESATHADVKTSVCYCQEDKAYWGNENNSTIIYQTDFSYYATEFLSEDLYNKYDTVLQSMQADKAQQIEQTYINFWNAALSFVTMGTMLTASIFSNSKFLMEKFSENRRVVWSNYLSIICLVITIGMVFFSLEVPMFFSLTLIIVVLVNITTGIFQTAMFQYCPKLSGHLFTQFIAGQAASGVFANLCAIGGSLLFQRIYEPSENAEMNKMLAACFFGIGAISVVVAIAGWKTLPKLDIIQHYLQKSMPNNMVKSSEDEYSSGTTNDENKNFITQQNNNNDPDHQTTVQFNSNEVPAKPFVQARDSTKLQIIKKSAVYYFSIWLCYTVTLSIFPALVADTKSVNFFNHKDGCGNDNFNPIFFKAAVLLTFNLGDYFGRQNVDFFAFFGIDKVNSGFKCLRLAFIRLIFIFIFYFGNITGTRRVSFLANDYIFVIAMFLFGASNGYLSTKAFIFGPERMETNNDKAIAGGMNVTFLTLGLMSGAACSFLTKSIMVSLSNSVLYGQKHLLLMKSVLSCYEMCN